MGFIKAGFDSITGNLADTWKDFITTPSHITDTSAFFAGQARGENNERGSNTKGSDNVITNGSKVIVPEGYGLVTIEDGMFTNFIAEPGGFIFSSDSQDAKSFFGGDGIFSTIFKTSWDRFKYGGRPGSQQQVFFVSLKEIPNNKFGTQSEIYWDDLYLNAQVGALARGTYTLKIVDPLLFIKQFVPASYLDGTKIFDFSDLNNDAATQLFNEVVGSLQAAFSAYTNDPSRGNRMARIQQDSIGFAQSLSLAVEDNYQWKTARGLEIVKAAVISIEYDADTRELLSKVKRADALSGARGNSNLQASVAEGFESAGQSEGGAGNLIGLGMAGGSIGIGGLQQPTQQAQPAAPAQTAPAATPAAEDPLEKLKKLKELLDAGVITQEDFDAAKAKALGL